MSSTKTAATAVNYFGGWEFQDVCHNRYIECSKYDDASVMAGLQTKLKRSPHNLYPFSAMSTLWIQYWVKDIHQRRNSRIFYSCDR